ncbi:MAG TPA: hypothetical protein GXX41_12990 [Thermoanaerobacterium sp.]|nr:hypothetical protein [Thermoanaerobacterium sp.]
MKYVVVDINDAVRYGYLDPDQKWEGSELLIGEDGYAYIDDVANDPVKGNWDFEQACIDFPNNVVEI